MPQPHHKTDPALPLGTLWDDSDDGWANELEELRKLARTASPARLRAFRRWYDRGMARPARPRPVAGIGDVYLNGFEPAARTERLGELEAIAAAERVALGELSDFVATGAKDNKGRLAARLRFWFLQDRPRKATRAALLAVARAARTRLRKLIRLRRRRGVGIVNGVANTELQLAKRHLTPAAALAEPVAHYRGFATAYGDWSDFFVRLGWRAPYTVVWDGFPTLSPLDKAATIFHEMTHLYLGTTDYLGGAYRTIGWDFLTETYSRWDPAKVATDDALNHADTWAGLVLYTAVPAE